MFPDTDMTVKQFLFSASAVAVGIGIGALIVWALAAA